MPRQYERQEADTANGGIILHAKYDWLYLWVSVRWGLQSARSAQAYKAGS